MTRWPVFLCLALLGGAVLAADALQPSRAGQAFAVSATAWAASGEAEVSLELADAVALALRDNRAIRSAYLERIAQKFDLRVARDHYAPQLSFKARTFGNRNSDVRWMRRGRLTWFTGLGVIGRGARCRLPLVGR
ncbi:hypothetical protein [Pseudomonas putida]|uniref:hypothetical protein n=1 Tax=Pseudomonas putida TaxID=303 RepID=UPI003AF045B8